MIGKFGISGAFAIVCLYTPEVFPTTLRFFCVISCLLMHNVSKGTGFSASTLAVLASAVCHGPVSIRPSVTSRCSVKTAGLDTCIKPSYIILCSPQGLDLSAGFYSGPGGSSVQTVLTRALKAYLFPRYYTVTCLTNRTRLLCLRTLPKIVNI